MKKVLFFLLTFFVAGVMGAKAQSYTDEDLSVIWSMADGSTSIATTSPAAAISATSWSIGSDLAIDGTATGTYFDNASTRFTRVGSDKLANDRSKLDNSYVEFKFKPTAGVTVTPKTLSFDIVKVGTGDPNIWVECVQGSTTTSIAENEAIRRNNEETPSEHKSYDLTALSEITATTGETAIRIYIGKLANNKQVAIANVTVEGKVDGNIQKFTTVYNIASSMMDAPSNFEGNSGTLAPTTADEAAGAPDMGVDATNGKLGKNNADWAQLNAGTILSIAGVPEGATISFVLYSSTALTINGVPYTNGQTFTATKDQNVSMECTTSGYIQSITVEGPAFVYVPEADGYTNTWQFGKSNGAEEFALQKSPEYTYTVGDYSLVINTDAGKLNNASRTDQWCQCNDGTKFKVPVYAGSKLTWGRYNGGSETGFTIDGQLYNENYIATEEGTVEMTATGIAYMSFIKIEPATLCEVTGTISGGDINGSAIQFTSSGNGQKYSAVVAENAFTVKVPAGIYTPGFGNDVAYVVTSPESVTVSDDGSIGEITIATASAQIVTGNIVNAPAEAFTLTFTGASHVEKVDFEAGATSFTKELMPDTYTISSSVGTLSPLSVESFQVVKDAVNHNIYFPEAAVPAATQQNIVVDNTLATVSANNYKTITDALAAAKAGNISDPVIILTSGQTYQEQVVIDQANVTFKTSGEEKATITFYYGIGYTYYSLNANGLYDKDRAMTRNDIKMLDPVRWGATVLIKNTGNGFKAENIIFENSFNQRYTAEEVADGVRPNGCQSITYDRTLAEGASGYKAADAKDVTERAAAIAFENNPKGCQLYNCRFVGSQDTFYSSGTLYVKDCDIVGNTDYIFGGGQVVFDNCNLEIGGYSDRKASAYLTAQKGNTGDAYIFRDCTVTSSDRTYVAANLGRDWGGASSTVYFFNLKNKIGDNMSYTWTNMGGGVSAGTANLHIYDFDPAINANYSTTGSTGANINGLLSDDEALSLYAGVVTRLGFTPEKIYDGNLELSESSAYNVCRIAANDNVERSVVLNRAIAAGSWNTIVLPFAVSKSDLETAFGTTATVAQFTSVAENALNFSTVTTLNANEPYLIKVDNDVNSVKSFGNVTIVNSADPKVTLEGFTFQGIYVSGIVPADSYVLTNDYLSKVTDDQTVIDAFRAYFSGNSTASQIDVYVDGVITGIKIINKVEFLLNKDNAIFDLQGRQVTNPKQGNYYIINGVKVKK